MTKQEFALLDSKGHTRCMMSRDVALAHAINALKVAIDSLRTAEIFEPATGSRMTDLADARRSIETLLSSDHGECGLEVLRRKMSAETSNRA